MWADAFVARPSIASSTPDWKANFLRKNAAFYREHAEVIREWRGRRFGPLRQSVADFPPSRRKFEWQAREAQPSRSGRSLWDLVIHLRPSGIRVRPPTYLPALVAITQTSIIGSRRRRITPREAARLQGINYEPFVAAEVDDAAIYRQMGNAVNVGAVQWVARALFAAGGEKWGRSRIWLEATSQSTQQESLLASLTA
ncbi:MAG: DNA cytosine methyltransferase [Acidobacteriota bacterium]